MRDCRGKKELVRRKVIRVGIPNGQRKDWRNAYKTNNRGEEVKPEEWRKEQNREKVS